MSEKTKEVEVMSGTSFLFGAVLVVILVVAVDVTVPERTRLYRQGRDAGYRQGQIDAAEGRWKYAPTTQRVYVEVQK